MWQRCVIIENLLRCPPISHPPGRPGHRSPPRLNVPEKQDKLWLTLSHSACCPALKKKGPKSLLSLLAAHKGWGKKKIPWRQLWSSSVSLQWWVCVCVWRRVCPYHNHLHVCTFCSPLSIVLLTHSSTTAKLPTRCKEQKGKKIKNLPAFVAGVYVESSGRPRPGSVFVTLSCSCCTFWNSEDQRQFCL